MSHDVFISFSAKDKAIADAVCAKLENNKIRCWIAPRDILPGVEYGQALVDGIKKSRVVVLVLSSNSNVSSQVMREIERAVSNEIPIIPLRIENITPSKSMEYYLSSVHWLDAITPPIEKHLDKLTDTVFRILGGQISIDEEPGELPPAGPQRMGVETTRKEAAAQPEAEEHLLQDAEIKARQAAEVQTWQEEQARLERAAEEKSRREAEERLWQEAEIKARQAAEEQARRDVQELEQRAAEQRHAKIAQLQLESETALAGGEWGKARQLISQLKNLGPDGLTLAGRLKKRLPKTKIPGWAWAVGGLVIVGIIFGAVFSGGGFLASWIHPTDTPRPVVQATENLAPQPVQSDTPTLISTTPTLTPTPTIIPLPTGALLINANVRAGPGTDYPVLAVYTAGTQVQVLGRNHAGDWLVIALPGDKLGWVALSSVQTGFDASGLTEFQAPPVPTLEPTQTAGPHPGGPGATPTLAPG